MCRYACALLPVILQFIFVREVSSTLCTKEELFVRTDSICPRDQPFCCGPKESPYCCSYAAYKFPFTTIQTIGIIVFVLTTFVFVVIIVKNFCCNDCIQAQHRNRQGNTPNIANQPAPTTTTATAHYSAQPPYPMQTFRTVYQQQHPEQQSFNPAAISSSQEHFQYLPTTPTAPISRPIGWFFSRRLSPPPPYPISLFFSRRLSPPPPYPFNDQPP